MHQLSSTFVSHYTEVGMAQIWKIMEDLLDLEDLLSFAIQTGPIFVAPLWSLAVSNFDPRGAVQGSPG